MVRSGCMPASDAEIEELEASGMVILSHDDAERRWSAGERIYAYHDQDEGQPVLVFDHDVLRAYAPDQLLALPEAEMSDDAEDVMEFEFLRLHEAQNGQPSRCWSGDWMTSDDGACEARPLVAKLEEVFIAGADVCPVNSEGSVRWEQEIRYASQLDAQRAASKVAHSWANGLDDAGDEQRPIKSAGMRL